VAISLGFGPADLARCRFAYSPMFETLAAVRIATGPQGPGPGPHHPRWLQQTRPRLRALDLRPITLLQPRRGYTPDFLSPPPLSPFSDFAAELTRMSATPAPVVHQEIEMSLLETPGAQTSELGRLLLGDPAEVLSLLTQLVRAAWHALVEPVWPRVRAALEADIAYQSRRLAGGGLDNLFADLDQTLSWITEPPWQPTVVYRARGLGDLWQSSAAPPRAALERLVGRTRAALLTGLAEPASTMWLSQRHHLAPGTVSEHLKVLREAGLVVGERHRHEIRYRRTRLGSALIRGSE